MTMEDIVDRDDIIKLVDSFYEKVRKDQLLAPIFKDLDWPAHLPTMYNFWSSLLLGDHSYQGNPFQKHAGLIINRSHFTRWLELFQLTVDELFQGEKASELKERARHIAAVFQYKMNLYDKPLTIPH